MRCIGTALNPEQMKLREYTRIGKEVLTAGGPARAPETSVRGLRVAAGISRIRTYTLLPDWSRPAPRGRASGFAGVVVEKKAGKKGGKKGKKSETKKEG